MEATGTHQPKEGTMSYSPSPYGIASDIKTLEAVQSLRIKKVETAFIQRTDSAAKLANWHLQVAILDSVTADLQAARELARDLAEMPKVDRSGADYLKDCVR